MDTKLKPTIKLGKLNVDKENAIKIQLCANISPIKSLKL